MRWPFALVLTLGTLCATPVRAGTCDPAVVGARAQVLAPGLGTPISRVEDGVIVLEFGKGEAWQRGWLALQLDQDQLFTSSSASVLTETLRTDLEGLGPLLTQDPAVLDELRGCKVGDLTPAEIISSRSTHPPATGPQAVSDAVQPDVQPDGARPGVTAVIGGAAAAALGLLGLVAWWRRRAAPRTPT